MRGPRKGDVASECAKLAVPTPMGSGTKGSQAHPPKGRAWIKRGAVKKPPITGCRIQERTVRQARKRGYVWPSSRGEEDERTANHRSNRQRPEGRRVSVQKTGVVAAQRCVVSTVSRCKVQDITGPYQQKGADSAPGEKPGAEQCVVQIRIRSGSPPKGEL